MRPRRTIHALALTATLVLAGCSSGAEGPDEPVVADQPTDGEAEPTTTGPDPTATEGDQDGAGGASEPTSEPTDDAGAPALEGDPSTDAAQAEPEWGGMLAVTDVRVAAHDGFERVVFEVAGDDGTIGWDVRYVDVPTSQGSGQEAEVDGEAFLSVSISGVALPPELPSGVEAFTDDVDGPAEGRVVEVVHDSIFEGYHLFFVGLDAKLPYVVERLEDPQRLVIDLHHG